MMRLSLQNIFKVIRLVFLKTKSFFQVHPNMPNRPAIEDKHSKFTLRDYFVFQYFDFPLKLTLLVLSSNIHFWMIILRYYVEV